MSEQQSKRQRVLDLLDAQIPQKVIAETVGVNIRTVERLNAAKKDGKSDAARAEGSGGHNKKRTEAFINSLKAKINADPTISMRRHSRDLNVSTGTIRKAVHDDLGLKSFVRVPRHLLTATMKERRLERCKKILVDLKHNGSRIKIFSDKKIFTVDQVFNRRNDRYLAESTDQVKGVFRTKHPQQVMVLGVIGSDGQKMPPYFFNAGEKIGTDTYYKVLRYTVLPWLKAAYPGNNYVWQQDGAPAHTATRNQKFCKDNMAAFWPKDFWPPSSPDLNPLDFFWWGAIESETNRTSHPNVDSLKASISKVWATYPADVIVKACATFRPRIEAVIAADGGHIK